MIGYFVFSFFMNMAFAKNSIEVINSYRETYREIVKSRLLPYADFSEKCPSSYTLSAPTTTVGFRQFFTCKKDYVGGTVRVDVRKFIFQNKISSVGISSLFLMTQKEFPNFVKEVLPFTWAFKNQTEARSNYGWRSAKKTTQYYFFLDISSPVLEIDRPLEMRNVIGLNPVTNKMEQMSLPQLAQNHIMTVATALAICNPTDKQIDIAANVISEDLTGSLKNPNTEEIEFKTYIHDRSRIVAILKPLVSHLKSNSNEFKRLCNDSGLFNLDDRKLKSLIIYFMNGKKQNE